MTYYFQGAVSASQKGRMSESSLRGGAVGDNGPGTSGEASIAKEKKWSGRASLPHFHNKDSASGSTKSLTAPTKRFSHSDRLPPSPPDGGGSGP